MIRVGGEKAEKSGTLENSIATDANKEKMARGREKPKNDLEINKSFKGKMGIYRNLTIRNTHSKTILLMT